MLMSSQEVEKYEAYGFVIVNNKPVRVKPGTLDELFQGSKECPARWSDLHVFAKLLDKPFAYLVSDDRKRWRVWCPCASSGLPVCKHWNERGLPTGVDLDENGKPLVQ